MTLPYLIIGAGVIALIAGWIGYRIGKRNADWWRAQATWWQK